MNRSNSPNWTRLTLALAGVAALAAVLGAVPSRDATGTPPAPAKYIVIDVKNGGTFTGTVLYGGNSVPEREVLDVDADRCPHEGELLAESLIVSEVDGKKRLQNAVVTLRRIRRGKAWPDVTYVVNNSECRFDPHVLVAPVDTDVKLKNTDDVMHNIHSSSAVNPTFNVAIPADGEAVTKTFAFAERISLRCDAHSWMKGWIVVVKNPYFAVTGADGTFSIGDIPAGTYKAEVWHETLGKQRFEVVIAAGASTTKSLTLINGE